MKMDVGRAIVELVENMLPRGTSDKILYTCVDCSISKGEKEARKMFHFIFQRPGSYTTVAMAVSDGIGFSNDLDFKFKSDHDSCWREDGVHSPLMKEYFAMCKEVDPKTAPKDLDCFVTFHGTKVMEGNIQVDRNNDYKVTVNLGTQKPNNSIRQRR